MKRIIVLMLFSVIINGCSEKVTHYEYYPCSEGTAYKIWDKSINYISPEKEAFSKAEWQKYSTRCGYTTDEMNRIFRDSVTSLFMGPCKITSISENKEGSLVMYFRASFVSNASEWNQDCYKVLADKKGYISMPNLECEEPVLANGN